MSRAVDKELEEANYSYVTENAEKTRRACIFGGPFVVHLGEMV